jgi:pyruvate/2-oxoglutarate dehydrogenase complex dihydrolipoamide acyltransferase (E2) component
MTDIIIPNLGNEISEAEITEWLVGIGEEVEEGDVILLISTTKTALEIAAIETFYFQNFQ